MSGADAEDGQGEPSGNSLAPLPGEAGIPDVARPTRAATSKKGILAVALLVISLIAVSVISIERLTGGSKQADERATKRAGDRPATASGEPRKLDLGAPSPGTAASSADPSPKIPAIAASDGDEAEPIGVHRTGSHTSATTASRSVPPEDAPVVIVAARPANPSGASGNEDRSTGAGPPPFDSRDETDGLAETRRHLETYEQQLQVLLDAMTRSATTTTPSVRRPPSGGPATGGTSGPSGGATTGDLFGGQLQKSATPRVAATVLRDRSLILPMGTAFTCALQTKIVSATSGFVSCLVQRNVFGADGRVLLVERGSEVDGEYRIASVKPGTVRIPVLWTRIRTPNGVTVDIDSPGTGQLGESGIDGYVDNRWIERIGAAMLLSLIDDSVQLALQHESGSTQGNAVVMPSTTTTTGKLAEKVLDSTINIPPLIYRNQGGIVGVYVARDVDFSSVYALQPLPPKGQP